MKSPEFTRRMERVLASRVEAAKAREARPRRLAQAAGVIVGTLACFFVLKGAAVAHNGGPLVRAEAGLAEAGLGAAVWHWFAGADPVSSALAAAINPALSVDANPARPTLIPESGTNPVTP